MIDFVRTTGTDPRSAVLRAAMDAETYGMYAARFAAMDPAERAITLEALATNPDDLVEVVLAVEDGSTDIGHAALRRLPDGYEVKKVFVVPEARRRGLSRQLMTEIEAVARQLGESRIRLQTGPLQIEAVALYGAIGYQRIAAFGPYTVLGPDMIYFAKEL